MSIHTYRGPQGKASRNPGVYSVAEASHSAAEHHGIYRCAAHVFIHADPHLLHPSHAHPESSVPATLKRIHCQKCLTIPTMPGVLSVCCRCAVEKPTSECFFKQKANKWEGTHDQVMCNPCNALNSRVGRMLKSSCEPSVKEHFRDLSAEERKKFYKDASLLCGPELRKTLTETVTWSQTQKRSWLCEEEGDFRPLAEVREELKDKPDELALVEANAPQTQHPHTKVEMVLMTTLKWKQTTHTEEHEVKKRELASEKNIAGVKKAKIAQVEVQASKADAKSKEEVVVPEAQKKKLTNLVPKAQELQFQVAWQPLNLFVQFRL